MSENMGYEKFLTKVGEMLTGAMPEMDRERGLLDVAEAEVHRLKMQLAIAEERQEILRERYRRSRGVFMEMWGTWKDEILAGRTAAPAELDAGQAESKGDSSAQLVASMVAK